MPFLFLAALTKLDDVQLFSTIHPYICKGNSAIVLRRLAGLGQHGQNNIMIQVILVNQIIVQLNVQ